MAGISDEAGMISWHPAQVETRWVRGVIFAAAGFLAAMGGMIPPAMAADASAWDRGHASQARLIAGLPMQHVHLVGLEIQLAEGYKTYWRHAGDSGLPPEIDWSESSNVADLALAFPAPARFRDASGTFFGYEEAVTFPLHVTPRNPDHPVDLQIALSYGVCKDVCIPAFATLSLALEPGREGVHAQHIVEAQERVPRPVAFGDSHGGLSLHDHVVSAEGVLHVRAKAPAGALLMAEGPDYRWFLDPDETGSIDPETGLMVFEVDLAETPREIREPARFTFTLVSGASGIESDITLDAATLRRLAR